MPKRAEEAPAASAAPSPPARTFGARVADLGLILVFLGLTFLLGVFPVKDTDLWWHLRTGQWILQHGQVPTHDLYTFTVPDHPWVDLHWAFEVLLWRGYTLGGIVGLNLAKCVVTCVAVLLLITARRKDWPVWPMLIAWLPALYLLGGRMYVRPETLTLFYLAVDLAVLFRWKTQPRLAFLLPVVQVLWVNTQGLFVLGPIVIAMALCDALLQPGAFPAERRAWWRTIGLATLLTGAACLANPYFVRGALFPKELAETMQNDVFNTSIAELQSLQSFVKAAGWSNFQVLMHLATMTLGALSFLIPLCWVAATRQEVPAQSVAASARSAPGGGRSKRRRSKPAPQPAPIAQPTWRLSLFRLLLFVTFSYLSQKATRNSHQFAAVVGTVTAWNFGEWAAALRARRDAAATTRRGVIVPRLLAFGLLVLMIAAIASGRLYALAGEGRTIGLGEEPLWYPHEAVKFAGRDGMPGRFLSFHNGHSALYEFYHGPERKVFCDARLEVIGPELYQRYVNLSRRMAIGSPGWDEELRGLGYPVVLTDNKDASEAGSTLFAAPHWRCVWFDPIAAVFVHDSSAEIVRRFTVDFGARHFQPQAATTPGNIPALVAAARSLRNYSIGLQARGRTSLMRPLNELGIDYALKVIDRDRQSSGGWKLLGQLELMREGGPSTTPIPRFRMTFDPVFDLSPVRTTYALERALELDRSDFTALATLAESYGSRGMQEPLVAVLERLASLTPVNRTQRAIVERATVDVGEHRARLGFSGLRPSPANRSEHDRLIQDLLAAGRPQTAALVLERDYPPESRSWEVTDRLATLWLHLGRPARARAVWQQAVSLPRPAVRAARVAATYLAEEQLDRARRAYHDALALDASLFEAHYSLAILEQDAGWADAALTSAQAAMAHAPGDVAQGAAQAIAAWVEKYARETNATSKK